MKRLLVLLVVLCTSFLNANPWVSSWEEAVIQSKLESKPICIVFTAPEWCYWCKRLDNDILLPSFFSAIDHQLIFYKVVVGMDPNSVKPEDIALLNSHEIKGFPTVVVVDAENHEIAKSGYLELTPEEYAQDLLNKIQ